MSLIDDILKKNGKTGSESAGLELTATPVEPTTPVAPNQGNDTDAGGEKNTFDTDAFLNRWEEKYRPEQAEQQKKRKLMERYDQLNLDYDRQFWDWKAATENPNNYSPMERDRIITTFENTSQARQDILSQVSEQDKYYWEQNKLIENAYKDKDFASYAVKGATVENPKMADVVKSSGILGPSKKPVNKVMYTLMNWDAYEKLKLSNNNPVFGTMDAYAYGLYDLAPYMKEDEVKIYNYYFAKDMENGTKKADEYLRFMEEILNKRKSDAIRGELKGKVALQLGYAAIAGLDQLASGIKNLGSMVSYDEKSNYIPTSAAKFAGSAIREDLADTSIPYFNAKTGKLEDVNIFGNSVGQMAYDSIQTGANMAPSILLSTAVGLVNPVAGAVTGGVLLGASAAGNAYEEKIQAGWTQSEARAYGTLVGTSEAVLESTLGAVAGAAGKGVKGFLGKVAKNGIQKIDNVLARVAKTAGGKIAANALGEGMEEGIQSILEPAFAHVVAGEEFTFDMEEALYSALLGAVMGAGFGAASPNTYQGNNSSITANEKAVLRAETEARVKAQQEKLGRELTAKEKSDIENKVRAELEKGYVSTDRIEEVLGGESWKKYREAYDQEQSVLKDLEGLYEGEELERQRKAIRDNSVLAGMREELSRGVSESVKNDRFLRESYLEKGRQTEKFTADVSKYKGKQAQIVQKAIDSGVLNNTNRAHELVDLIAKIGADKDIDFDFVNNEKLKQSGFALEGVTVNGYVNENGIAINISSQKALNSVVGHEITHVLEGTELYTELAEWVKAYANIKEKDGYNNRLKQLISIYQNVEGYKGAKGMEKIRQEVVADLVGDYLFTDEAFVKRLLQEKPGLFRRLWNEIKYLATVTSGTEEARRMAELQRAFEKAYRSNSKSGFVDSIQISEPVEETKTLLAMHNLSEADLRSALDRGSLIMPSVAVAESANSKFGPITAVISKEAIDPAENSTNKLYGADAWTPNRNNLKKNPRFDTNKTETAIADIRNQLGAAADQLFDVTAQEYMDAMTANTGSIYAAYAQNLGMKTAYALEAGLITEIPTKADGTVDTAKLKEALGKVLVNDTWGKYKKWLDSISDETVTSYDTATSEDILANMQAQPATAKPFRLTEDGKLTVPATEYAGIEDLRQNRGRLSQNADAAAEQTGKKLLQFAKGLGTDTAAAVKAINEGFGVRYDAKKIRESFSRNGVYLSNEQAQQLQALYKEAVELPTEYFEAKPGGKVDINQIGGFAVPVGTDPELIRELQDRGFDVREYDPNQEGSRAEVVNGFENLKFSLNQGTEATSQPATKKPTQEGGVKFSFGVTQENIDNYIDAAYRKANSKDHIKYAEVSDRLLKDVSDEIDIEGYAHALRDNDIRHIRNSHGENTSEKYPITKEDLAKIPNIVTNYDKVFVKTNAKGNPGLVYVKVGENNVTYYVEAVTEEYHNEKLLVNKQMIKTGIDEIPNLHGLIAAINKKESSSQYLADLQEIRKAYVQDVKENYSTKKIAQNKPVVNNKKSLSQDKTIDNAEGWQIRGEDVSLNRNAGNSGDALSRVHELLEAAKPDPVFDALKSYRDSGIVSDAKAAAILASPEALQQLTEQTGIPIEGTKPQQQAAVKEAVAKIDEPAVDNTAAATYDNTINQGGIYNGQRLQQNDGAGGSGNSAEGMAGVQRSNPELYQGGQKLGGVAVGSGVLRVSQELQSAQASRGTPTYPIYDTTAKPDSYAAALEAGRASDVKNGWCVTPKTAQDLQSENVRTVMNADGTVGAGIAPNGDIVAVFKNKNGGPAKALHTLMPAVIEQGGDRLDCYGEGLVRVYAQYGFVPVAKVEFNPEYANDGWTPDKGTPYIYFMAHNGDSAAMVAQKIGTYQDPTKQQLDSLPTFGKESYDEAMAYRDNYMDRKKASAPSPNESVGAAPAGFGEGTYEEVQSKVISNSYANATDESMRRSGEEALKNDPDIGTYYRSKEATSVRNAEARTQTKEQVEYEYRYLMENGINSAEDLDTSMRVREALFEAGDKRFQDMVRLQRQTGTKSGQITQAFAKYSRMSADSVAAEVVDSLDQLTQDNVPKKFWKKEGFDQFKEKTLSSAMDIAKQIGSVEDGDVDSMKDIIRSLARFRKTTAWFGTSSNLTKTAEAAMNSLTFEEAKAIANAQLSTLPNDFKKRPVGQIVKTFRIHNMLYALTTINRNLTGNATIGFVDAVSDSTVGRFFDHLVSKATGKRTVGNDVKYAKTYFTKAWDATKMAALCAELDIPMEDETKYSVGRTRTYSTQGGPVMRFFSAYEKYLKYALEVTDQFFAGGTNATVDESLSALGESANLAEDEKKAVSELAGQRRTFKDERTATRLAKDLRKGLNHIGTENIGLGDITMPFASIGSTMAHTATDYTAGAITGTVQILQLISDVKHGKYVDVDGVKTKTVRGKNGETRQITLAEAQRAAVTNAARGVTGIPLIATFTALALAGVLKVHDDDDPEKRALYQSQNLSGAQLNIDAALRGLTGGSTEWRDDDAVISLDFLEPFNAQMYLGWLAAQEDSVADAFANYPKNTMVSVVKSIADMPAMQGMQEAMDLLSGLTSLDEDTDLGDWATDAAGTFLGSTASSFIPSWLRQTAQVIDPYYRDTTGENALDSAWNQFAAAVPFLSQSLPKKYSGLGQEQRRYEDLASGIFNTLINPGDADRLNLSDVASYLDEVSERTGDESIYPSYRAPGSVGSGDDKIVISGKDMTEKYQKTYGENVNRLYGDLIASSDFEAMDDESKTKILNTAKSYASELAKNKIGAEANIPKYISERPSGMSETEAIIRHFAYGSSEKYASLPVETATFVDELLASLTPPSGKKAPTISQQIAAITGADNELTERQQTAVLKETLSDSAYEKYLEILEKGYSNDEYAESYEIYAREKDKGGKGTKDRTIEMFQREFHITKAAATTLYEIYNPK